MKHVVVTQHRGVLGWLCSTLKATWNPTPLSRALFTPLLAIAATAFLADPPAVRAQTFDVSSGSQSIDRVSSTGTVSLFATLPANSGPEGLAVDSSGNLYVADFNTNQISETGGGGVGLFATLPANSRPVGLAFDISGNLYAADSGTNQISKITSGGVVSLFATLPANSSPVGLAFGGGGNLYAADAGTNQISKITSGGAVSTFATLPANSFPQGLAFDTSGNLYVADQSLNQISKITFFGAVSTFATGITSPNFIEAVPEPSTWAASLLTAGALLCSIWRRRAGWLRSRTHGC
jgi:sugar lactone lactonase YvrE